MFNLFYLIFIHLNSLVKIKYCSILPPKFSPNYHNNGGRVKINEIYNKDQNEIPPYAIILPEDKSNKAGGTSANKIKHT